MNPASPYSMQRLFSPSTALGLVLALFIVVAGCEPETEPPPEDPTLAPDEVEPRTVVHVLQEDPRFSEFADALEHADLVQTLHGPGPFTIFAPTNEAFDELPEETWAELYDEERRDDLIEILTYHIVSGRLTIEELGQMESTTTLHGSEVTLTPENEEVLLDQQAGIIDPNIDTDNGIVHAIDAVLTPPENDLDDPAAE